MGNYIKLTPEQWEAKKLASKLKADQKKNLEHRKREQLFKEATKYHKGEYKPIPSNPEYIAFDNGKIWSSKRGKFLKASNCNGYMMVGVDGGKLLARIIANTFIPNPDDLTDISYKDGNYENCDVKNLEWCSHSQNMRKSLDNKPQSLTKMDLKQLEREQLFIAATEAHEGQWKAVPENPGYIAFDDGRIWSYQSSKFLKTANHRLGYLFIGKFFVNGKYSLQLLHRMIAFTFIPNPEGFPEINHKDGNKHNNDISNLEWCNRQYNMQHAKENGLMIPGMLNKKSTRRKLTFEQAEEIREKYKENVSMESLAIEYGIHPSNVKRILKGTTYKVQ